MKTYLVDIYLAYNLGDDMFLDHLATSFPDRAFVPFFPGTTYDTFFRQYPNIQKFPYSIWDKIVARLRVTNKLQNYAKMARQYDGLIFLGGGIFREESYWKEVFEYRTAITTSFKAQNLPVCFIGCNFGPFQSTVFKEAHETLFGSCTTVQFRDNKSFFLFQELPTVSYAPDVLWDYKLPKVVRKEKTLGISVIDSNHKSGLENYYQDYVESHIAVIKSYLREGYSVKLFSFCENEGDLKVCKELAKVAPSQIEIHNYTGNIQEYLTAFGSCSEIIAARFHAVIIAMKYNIPVLPVIYGDKTRNLLQDLSFKNASIEFNTLKEIKKINTQNYVYPEIGDFVKNASKHFKGI